MSHEMIKSSKRLRISVDLQPETQHQLRAVAKKELTTHTDPVLAELWDNEKDAAYNNLST